MASEEARVRESTTAAHQSVGDLHTAEFQQVEKALMAKPEERQVDLLKELSMFKDTLDQPEKGSELIQQLLEKKKTCEEETKSLNKAVNPHRLWAKNAQLI
eukprot:s293_g41.t1